MTLRMVCGSFSVGFALVSLLLATDVVAQPDSGGTGDGDSSETETERSADPVARSVVETAGDPSEVKRVEFVFVVEVDGEEKVRRRHRWWPNKGEVTVESGGDSVTLTNLHSHELSKPTDNPDEHADTWSEVAEDAEPQRAAKAWAWFVNDSYWLFAPSKLFDSGVERSIDDQGQLVLTFEGVGLTPGDRYALTVDRERGVITRWDYELESGREGAYRWRDYQSFGPLRLSTRRVSTGGEKNVVIRFEEIEVDSGNSGTYEAR